ncbi:MAG: zinc-ribbon domain-containing protein [Lachnospiraceae bacterium]|nr:zinc-ribbon domain-containing protein [Lachnospiraceae bacterium]
MFCGKCGAENPNGAKFCGKCGAPLIVEKKPFLKDTVASKETKTVTKSTTGNSTSGESASEIKIKPLYIIIGVVVVVLLIVVFLLSSFLKNKAKTIDLNKYVAIETTGYNGYGSNNPKIDWETLEKDYEGKIKFKETSNAQALQALVTPMEALEDAVAISMYLYDDLSNGDTVEYSWSISDEYMNLLDCNIKYEDGEYVVSGLPDVTETDIFEKLAVSFSGEEPYGEANWEYSGEELSSYDFDIDKEYDLSNGDEVTVTLDEDEVDDLIREYGIKPSSLQKSYVVEGLESEEEEESDSEETVTSEYTEGVHNYQLVVSDASWEDAFNECYKKGGYLACIETEEEFEAISNLIKSQNMTGYTFWIGACRDSDSEEYHWVYPGGAKSGEILQEGNTKAHWLTGEPSLEGDYDYSNMTTTLEETCVDLIYRSKEDVFCYNDVYNNVTYYAEYLKGSMAYIMEYEDEEDLVANSNDYSRMIVGEWSLPYNNRAYMNFSNDGTVNGYEYNDVSYTVSGNELQVGSETFTIDYLDNTWLGLKSSSSENTEYSFNASTSATATVEDALKGKWISTDFSQGEYGGLEFSNNTWHGYYGEPDLMDNYWSMAATVTCMGMIEAKDGTINVYFKPNEISATYKYHIDDNTLYIEDGDYKGTYTKSEAI